MKMIKKIVFFDDLSTEAKERARQWYKDGNDFDFLEEYMAEFITEKLQDAGFSDIENLNVAYSLGYSQGDGASFTCAMHKNGENYEVNRNSSNYSHEMTISEVYHENENGEQIDEPALLEQMRDIAKQAEKAGYAYIESENDDENVDENMHANGYTFTLEGVRMDADNQS